MIRNTCYINITNAMLYEKIHESEYKTKHIKYSIKMSNRPVVNIAHLSSIPLPLWRKFFSSIEILFRMDG